MDVVFVRTDASPRCTAGPPRPAVQRVQESNQRLDKVAPDCRLSAAQVCPPMPRVRPNRVFSLEIIVVPAEVDRNQTAWLDTMRSPMTDPPGLGPHVRRPDALATATLTRRGCLTSRGADRAQIYAVVAVSQRFWAGQIKASGGSWRRCSSPRQHLAHMPASTSEQARRRNHSVLGIS